MLNTEPNVDPAKSQKALDMWKILKPLTVEEIMQNSTQAVSFDDPEIEYKEVQKDNCLVQG